MQMSKIRNYPVETRNYPIKNTMKIYFIIEPNPIRIILSTEICLPVLKALFLLRKTKTERNEISHSRIGKHRT